MSSGAFSVTIAWIRSAMTRSAVGHLGDLRLQVLLAGLALLARRELRLRLALAGALLHRGLLFRRSRPCRCAVRLLAGGMSSFSFRGQAVAFWRGLALLEDPDRVAERIAEAHVRAVEVVGGLLREVGDAALLERLVEAVGIVGDEHEAAQRPLVMSSRSCAAVASSCSGGPGCSSEISVPGSPGTRTVSQR